MIETVVAGGDGVRLALRDVGPRDAPPIVFLHGWAQSSRAWEPVLRGPLARRYRLVAPDLRGHGESQAPATGYDDPERWAADVASVLAYVDAPAVLVGWSYGGMPIVDYLRVRGSVGLAGLALVGAVTELGRGRKGGKVGPTMRAALPDVLAEDPETAVPALAAFVDGISATALAGSLRQQLLGAALLVPPSVRGALFARDVDAKDVLTATGVPALVLHGLADTVVDPSAGEYAARLIPGADTYWFDGVGHLPFHERSDEFTSVLGRFADGCLGVGVAPR